MEGIDRNWRKSSRSGNGAECVEVATDRPGTVAVRDSKNPDGPALVFPAADWQAFTASVKTGQHDLT